MKLFNCSKKGNDDYADCCLRHSFFNYGLIVDKITITCPISLLTSTKCDSTNFDLLQYGERICISIVGEAIDPQSPFFVSVQTVLWEMATKGLLNEHVVNLIQPYLDTNMEISSPVFLRGFLEVLKELHFCFSGLELAFDYFTEDVPYRIIAPDDLIVVEDTLYTKDYHQTKGRATQSSLVCIYNRSAKLTAESNGCTPFWLNDMQVWRLEFRVKQDFGRFLSIDSLCCDLQNFILTYGHKIKAKADRLLQGVIIFKKHNMAMWLEHLADIQEKETADITDFIYKEENYQ